MASPKKKYEKLFVYVTEDEATLLDRVPGSLGVSFSPWGREVIRAAIRKELQTPPSQFPSAIVQKNGYDGVDRDVRRVMNLEPADYEEAKRIAGWRSMSVGTWAWGHLMNAAVAVHRKIDEDLAQAKVEARREVVKQVSQMLEGGMSRKEIAGWLKQHTK